jgi:ribokinase
MSALDQSAVPRIAVVGSLNYDILIEGGTLPRQGETAPAAAWAPKCGGKGGNQAIEAARHGAAVRMIGAVGRDHFGDALLANLDARSVDGAMVARVDARSGFTVALFDEARDYRGIFVPAANAALSAEWVTGPASEAIAQSAVLALQNEVPAAANRAAAELARSAGACVVWNAAPVAPVDEALLALTDVLVVNAIEAEGFGAAPVHDLASAGKAARALAGRAPAVVVTAGAAGLAVADGDTAHVLPAHDVAVASAHGAGDAFCGALAVRLALGDPLGEAVLYANAAAGALVATPEEARATLGAGEALRRLSTGPALTPA